MFSGYNVQVQQLTSPKAPGSHGRVPPRWKDFFKVPGNFRVSFGRLAVPFRCRTHRCC